LSEHTSPFDALVQVLEGEVEITIGGKPHRVIEGQLILMPANQPHALKALKRFMMILTMIRSRGMSKINNLCKEVIEKSEWVAIATAGPNGAHLAAC
jgi:quercetin dioxygenase-like cupin family protein